MNELSKAFENGKAFVGFLTAGDPDLACTERYVGVMDRAGADIIEIGVPFSDPIAEGPVIQAANVRALTREVGLKQIFEMTARLSATVRAPLVLLTYLNPVFRYGYDAFFADCAKHNVSGVVIPDCPFEERGELLPAARKNGVDVITLIAPTSDARIRTLSAEATGFVYLVSSMGVTGVREAITTDIGDIVRKIRAATNTPVCVGFGISTPDQAKEMAALSDGVIVGSAIVRIIARLGAAADRALFDYVSAMKQAVMSA